MPEGETKSQPIIADPDLDFLKSMNADPQAKDLPPLLAGTAAEALKLITTPGIRLSAIFINPDLQGPLSIALVQTATKLHPESPIYFLSANQSALTESQLEQLTVKKVILKPATYTELLRTAKILPSLFNADEAMAIADTDVEAVGVEQKREEGEFFSLCATKFISGSTLLFNVYDRADSGSFVKILQAGEVFEPAKLTQHLERNRPLFLAANAQAYYLKYTNWLCAALIGKEGVPFNVKLGYVLSIGEQVTSSMQRSGYSPDSLQNAAYYIERLRELAVAAETEDANDLKGALLDCNESSVELLASVAAVLLVKQIDYRSTRSFQIAGLSSLLQGVPSEKLEQLSALVDLSVVQNLRRSVNSKRFRSTVCEIVEASLHFAQLAKKSKTTQDLNFQIEKDLLPQYGKASPVMEAFRNLFVKYAELAA